MDSKRIKNEIAKHCDGNMQKYFNMVEIVNILLLNSGGLSFSKEVDFIEKVSSIYSEKFCIK